VTRGWCKASTQFIGADHGCCEFEQDLDQNGDGILVPSEFIVVRTGARSYGSH
jgi:hypothetical protein